jgi:glycerol-3-phosphate cytidylyltransferase-like family protein
MCKINKGKISMDRKDRREIAREIAKCEKIINSNSNEIVKQQAMNRIETITMRITSLEDILAIDDMVQKILEKN